MGLRGHRSAGKPFPLPENAVIVGGACRLDGHSRQRTMVVNPVKNPFVLRWRQSLIRKRTAPAGWYEHKRMEQTAPSEAARSKIAGSWSTFIFVIVVLTWNSSPADLAASIPRMRAFEGSGNAAKPVVALRVSAVDAQADTPDSGFYECGACFFCQ